MARHSIRPQIRKATKEGTTAQLKENTLKNWMKRAALFLRKGSDAATAQELINKMTNWQRHQWAKAGYPGKKPGQAVELDKIQAFTELRKSYAVPAK